MPAKAIFIHVPKTAGRTVESILHRNYPAAGVYALYGLWGAIPAAAMTLRAMSAEEKRPIQLVVGHTPFGWHGSFPWPMRYFAYLREPTDRIVSLYYYLLKVPRHPLLTLIQENGWSLGEFAQSGQVFDVDNEHTRYLSGVGQSVPIGQIGKEHLEQAKRNIVEQDILLGLTERFDESLVRIARHLEWRSIGYTVQNRSEGRPTVDSVDPAAVAAIRAANPYDLELYEFARARFEQQIAAEREQIDADLRRLEKAKTVARLKERIMIQLGKARAVAGRVKRALLRKGRGGARSA
jgi:hypothetical protein